MVKVSVIFVSYNTCQLVCQSIDSIYKFTKNVTFEIILVDNDSSDATISIVESKYPKVIIIKNRKNIGFGPANNVGASIAKGKYLFFLNTDTYLVNNAIDILYAFLESENNREVLAVGAQLFKPNMDFNLSAGNFPNFKLFVKGSFWKYFYPKNYFTGEIVRKIPENKDVPYEVDYVSGADFFIKRNVFDDIGGFDRRFFMYYEETELSHRLKRKYSEKKCMIVPSARIVHIGQGSSLNTKHSKSFEYRKLKSKTLYFRITEGLIYGVMYYIVSVKRLFFNK